MMTPLSAMLIEPSYSGRIVDVALEPFGVVTTTCVWQMSLVAFSDALKLEPS